MATNDQAEQRRPKPVFWIASSRKDLKKFPKGVRRTCVVYVLHAFQKKSKSGARTPAEEVEKVKTRLKQAEKHHAGWAQKQEGETRSRQNSWH